MGEWVTRTMPQSSWSSPDPCTYENPFERRSTPSCTCFEADTQMTGRYFACSGRGSLGNTEVAGVIHRGRRGRGMSGNVYADF